MRDRLIELLKQADISTSNKMTMDYDDALIDTAEYLLTNDVIVPPVHIGQELWDIHYNKPRKWEVVYLGFNGTEWFINLHYFKNKHNFATRQIQDRYLHRLFFLSEEEAEQALKGGEQG